MSGKPGNVMEFETCQGNVGEFVNNQELSGNKPCHGKRYQKLVVASCIFAFIQVFSSISYKNCTLLDIYILILSFVA